MPSILKHAFRLLAATVVTAPAIGYPVIAWAQTADSVVAPPASDTVHGTGGPRMSALAVGFQSEADSVAPDRAAAEPDTGAVRPRAVEYSEGYGRRLAIHRVASYAEFPLFAAEYILGQKLLNDERNGTRPSGLKTAHTIVAGGLGLLFATNTVTGVWNMWEARHDPAGRTRRTIHGVGMLLADAGFVWTAAAAQSARRSPSGANRHRALAITSMSIATASTLMMWLWKD